MFDFSGSPSTLAHPSNLYKYGITKRTLKRTEQKFARKSFYHPVCIMMTQLEEAKQILEQVIQIDCW